MKRGRAFKIIGIIVLLSLAVMFIAYDSLKVVVERDPVVTESGGSGSVEYYRPFGSDKPTKEELNSQGYYKDTDGVYRKKN